MLCWWHRTGPWWGRGSCFHLGCGFAEVRFWCWLYDSVQTQWSQVQSFVAWFFFSTLTGDSSEFSSPAHLLTCSPGQLHDWSWHPGSTPHNVTDNNLRNMYRIFPSQNASSTLHVDATSPPSAFLGGGWGRQCFPNFNPLFLPLVLPYLSISYTFSSIKFPLFNIKTHTKETVYHY